MRNTRITTALIIIFSILEVILWYYSLLGMNPFIVNILMAVLAVFLFVIAYRIYKTSDRRQRWFLIRAFVLCSLIVNLFSFIWLDNKNDEAIPRRYYEVNEG